MLRIVNWHAISHFINDNSHDDELHCELCEINVTSNKLHPFQHSAATAISQNDVLELSQIKVGSAYNTLKYAITRPQSVYNKPPPVYFNK